MTYSTDYFTLGPEQIISLGAVLVWSMALIVIGAVFAGRARVAEIDFIFGWALIPPLFTVVSLMGPIPFPVIVYLVLGLSLISAVVVWRRDGRLVDRNLLRALVLGTPLIILVADMIPSQWDEFGSWLPNARYLLDHGTFPRTGQGIKHLVFPAYPFGIPLLIYLVSLIRSELVEHAGALFNLILYLCFAVLVARIARQAVTASETDRGLGIGLERWGFLALGGLLVTILSPTFVPKIVFTAYADAGTAVTLGVAGALGWWLLDALATGDQTRARNLAVQFSLVAVALINLKQVNLVLMAALTAGILLTVLRDQNIRLSEALRLIAPALLAPISAYILWRLYVGLNIQGGEFSIRPPAEWRLDLLPDVLARMGLIATKKGGYFGVMLVAIIVAARALFRTRRNKFDRLAIIIATTFLLYIGFLLFSYIAAFGEWEAKTAASFWRYNMHLGGLAIVFIAHGGGVLWRARLSPRLGLAIRGRNRLSWFGIALLMILPLALAPKIRFDQVPEKIYVRAISAKLSTILDSTSRLAVLDRHDNGFFAIMLRYGLTGSAKVVARISAFSKLSTAEIAKNIDRVEASHVWVRRPDAETEIILGRKLAPGASYLLARDPSATSKWKVTHSWRYSDYR